MPHYYRTLKSLILTFFTALGKHIKSQLTSVRQKIAEIPALTMREYCRRVEQKIWLLTASLLKQSIFCKQNLFQKNQGRSLTYWKSTRNYRPCMYALTTQSTIMNFFSKYVYSKVFFTLKTLFIITSYLEVQAINYLQLEFFVRNYFTNCTQCSFSIYVLKA